VGIYTVTAGFKWPPETPPENMIPKKTPMPASEQGGREGDQGRKGPMSEYASQDHC
jgi:hypothetical protein